MYFQYYQDAKRRKQKVEQLEGGFCNAITANL